MAQQEDLRKDLSGLTPYRLRGGQAQEGISEEERQRRLEEFLASTDEAQELVEPETSIPPWLRYLGGAATRAGGAVLGSKYVIDPALGAVRGALTGGPWGAAGGALLGLGKAALIGSAAELAAQAIEENKLNQLDPASLGVAGVAGIESGIPIPFLQGRRPLVSMLRGSLVSGTSEGLREKIRGEDLDPVRIGGVATLGGSLSGLFSKIGRSATIPEPPTPR